MKDRASIPCAALVGAVASVSAQTPPPGYDSGLGPCERTITQSVPSNPDGHVGYARYRREYLLVELIHPAGLAARTIHTHDSFDPFTAEVTVGAPCPPVAARPDGMTGNAPGEGAG